MVDVVVVEPFGLGQGPNLGEAEFFRDLLGAEIFRRRRQHEPVKLQFAKRLIDHRPATVRHDPPSVTLRRKPVGGKPDPVSPVDAIVADDADDLPVGPNPTGEGTSVSIFADRRRDVLFGVGDFSRRVDPGKPLT